MCIQITEKDLHSCETEMAFYVSGMAERGPGLNSLAIENGEWTGNTTIIGGPPSPCYKVINRVSAMALVGPCPKQGYK